MIRPLTGCDSACSAVRAWYEQQAVLDKTCDREVDLLLAVCIDAERARARETRRQNAAVPAEGGSQPSLRAAAVVSEEVGQQLHQGRAPHVKVMEAYLRRAAAIPPEVQRATKLSCGREPVELARVVLKEPATEEELSAMCKLYPNRRMFGDRKDALKTRTQSVLQEIGADTPYLLVDASGCAAAVVVRGAYSDAALRGKRVLLLLHALQGLGGGYAKVCMGSGTLCERELRNFVKSEAGVGAWGLPKMATPIQFQPNGLHSGRLHYEHADGRVERFQCGSWVERREMQKPRVAQLLAKYDLLHLLPCVETYLSETLTAYKRYARVLLLGGRLNVLPEDLPEEFPDLFGMLSIVFLDGAGKSKLGIHTDTDQLCPCVCSCDSLYPPGLHDFRGGELFFANGVWAEPYSRRDLVILLGHTTMHTVLPLTPSHEVPFKGCQMLRGSLVHWSHAGKQVCGELRQLFAYRADILKKEMELTGQFYWDWCRNMRYQIRVTLKSGDLNIMPDSSKSDVFVEHPVVATLLGATGMELRSVLRLRGGHASGGLRCNKRKRAQAS